MTVIPSRALACLCISANLTYRCCRIFSTPEELIVEDKGATATQGGYLASSLDRVAGRGSVRVPCTSPVVLYQPPYYAYNISPLGSLVCHLTSILWLSVTSE
jgi:hypothetical protein